jgi:signal transduction histidine kinase
MTSADPHVSERLASEQAALRRVATLVARESSPEAVFGAVTEEAGRVLGAGAVGMLRFEPDGTATLVAQSDTPWDPPPLGTRFALDGENVVTKVFRTGEATRVDDWADATGPVAAMASVLGVRSCVATPIVVEGRTWGTLLAATNRSDPLPPDTESRVCEFTEFVATAIANAEARSQLSLLASEQAALRRVATLVARGATPEGVFHAVAAQVDVLFGGDVSAIVRFEADGTATVLGDVGGPHEPGKRVRLDPGYVVHTVRETSHSARFDTDDPSSADASSLVRTAGIRSAVASPIVVEGELWGAITAASMHGPLAPAAERRLTEFTELVATAVANTRARNEVTTLAEEQAALRRVATLVAQGVPAEDIFCAVSDEVARLFRSTMAAVGRFEPDEPAILIVGAAERTRARVAIGSRFELDAAMIATQVYRTGRSAHAGPADTASATPAAADFLRRINRMSSVASPIVVDGRLWGVMAVTSETEMLPLDSQDRLEKFTELVAIAITNADTRAELTASRARIVTASDDARRRIERDLHDGAQQRLVSLALELRMAAESVPAELPEVQAQLGSVANEIDGVIDDLREMSRGIHPAVLSDGGLGPAIETLALRAAVPVQLDLGPPTRFAPHVEVAAYYVVSEALTNTAKHANASRARVRVEALDGRVCVSIGDDGDGGAKMGDGGSGLAGLRDRVEALGGSFSLSSPLGQGTVVAVELPVTGDVAMAPT